MKLPYPAIESAYSRLPDTDRAVIDAHCDALVKAIKGRNLTRPSPLISPMALELLAHVGALHVNPVAYKSKTFTRGE